MECFDELLLNLRRLGFNAVLPGNPAVDLTHGSTYVKQCSCGIEEDHSDRGQVDIHALNPGMAESLREQIHGLEMAQPCTWESQIVNIPVT